MLIDLPQLLKFAAALLLVLGLMGGLALLMRRFGNFQGMAAPGRRRLKIVETLPLDARRRLMIVRRDEREHLIILGATGETVIETGIETGQDGKDDPV